MGKARELLSRAVDNEMFDGGVWYVIWMWTPPLPPPPPICNVHLASTCTWMASCFQASPVFYFHVLILKANQRTKMGEAQEWGDLLLNSQVAGSRVCGRSSSRWNYRPRPLSRRLFFQRVLPGSFWMSSVATVCQCGHKLHKTVTHSWINVLICIPCAWPAAIITFFVAREAGQSVQTYFSLPLAPPTGNKEKYGWLARLTLSLLTLAWACYGTMHTNDQKVIRVE